MSHTIHGVAAIIAKSILVGSFVAYGFGVATHQGAAHAATPVTEDSPDWHCETMGNRVCGPDNATGSPAGCYADTGRLVAAWPCHVVVDPRTGDGDVFTGEA